jgi:multisubunit Na+/H+ antiporter MnhB subunit
MPEGVAALDLLLAGGLVTFGALALLARDRIEAVLLFLVYGMLLAVVWVRLAAPDLALAEGVIGAGLTSALFLRAVRRQPTPATTPTGHRRGAWHDAWRGVVAALAVVAAAAVAWTALPALDPAGSGLRDTVRTALPASGVGNPVTAVLMNFRAYDTLLEVAVLLAAVCTTWHTAGGGVAVTAPSAHGRLLGRLLLPLLVLSAGYLLWVGADAPGGEFQAGALLAGGAVLRLLLGKRLDVRGVAARAVAVLGLVVFVGVGASARGRGAPFLAFEATQAGALLMAIELAATLSVGYLLAALYQGGRGV